MRVLITGASGLLGRHTAAAFAADGDDVVALVRPSSNTAPLKQPGIRLQVAGLDQPDALREAMRGCDAVVHCVARVHTHGLWREFYRTTVEGTRHTLEAARAANVGRFIHISTVGVYGWPRPDGRPYAETDPAGTPYRWNYYTRAKILAEDLVRQSPVPSTILRPTWVYGPNDDAGLGRIVASLRAGRLKTIGDGNNRLSLVYVADVARAIVAAARAAAAKGEIFNIAADQTCCTQREFITKICRITGAQEPAGSISYDAACRVAFLCECVAHATRYTVCPPLTRLAVLLLGGQRRYNGDKIRRVLGWQPSVDIEQGLSAALGHEPASAIVSR